MTESESIKNNGTNYTYYNIRRHGHSIELFSNLSSVLVYRIPYQNLLSNSESEQLRENLVKNNFIVYILIGVNNEGKDGKDRMIYVGKSNKGLQGSRPTSHENKCNNWTYCYILTEGKDKDHPYFNDAIIQYIENHINNRVNGTDYYNNYNNTTNKTNSNAANSLNIQSCDDYLKEAYDMLYILGLDLITHKDNSINIEDINEEEDKKYKAKDGIYHMEWKLTKRWGGNTVNAKMQVLGDKYIVLAGSTVCPDEGPSLLDSIREKRQNAKITNDILDEDVVFYSPSPALAFVLGSGGVNGWNKWQDEDNKPIGRDRNKKK